MRYIVNKNDAIRSVKALKSILELTESVFPSFSLSQIKKEYAVLIGYRDWNELTKFSKPIPRPYIYIDNILTPAFSVFNIIFGKDAFLRILNNQQFILPICDYPLSKKSIDFFKYIEDKPDYEFNNPKYEYRISIISHLLGKDIRISEYFLNSLIGNPTLDITASYDSLISWIKNPYGIFCIEAPPGRGKSLFLETYLIRNLLNNKKKVALLKYYHNKDSFRNSSTYIFDLPIIDINEIHNYDIIYIPELYNSLDGNIKSLLKRLRKPLITSIQFNNYDIMTIFNEIPERYYIIKDNILVDYMKIKRD